MESNVAASSVCANIFKAPVTLSAAKPACVKDLAALRSSLEDTPKFVATFPTSFDKAFNWATVFPVACAIFTISLSKEIASPTAFLTALVKPTIVPVANVTAANLLNAIPMLLPNNPIDWLADLASLDILRMLDSAAAKSFTLIFTSMPLNCCFRLFTV